MCVSAAFDAINDDDNDARAYFYIQCVSKNIPDIFSCNSRKHCLIFIKFGTCLPDKVSNQQMLLFPTTPN